MKPLHLSFFLVALGCAGVVRCEDETTIKGGRMELVNKGAEVIFTGGVKLQQGGDILNAQEMHTNKSRDKVTASGDVRLLRKVSSTETWKGWGEKGFYDTQAGTGYLAGGKKRAYISKTEVLSSTVTRVMEIWADRIDFYRQTQSTRATGHVQGKTTDPETQAVYEFFSEQAEYDGKTKDLVLSGANKSKAARPEEKNRKEARKL